MLAHIQKGITGWIWRAGMQNGEYRTRKVEIVKCKQIVNAKGRKWEIISVLKGKNTPF